jgi:hypothetical protein
MTSALMEKSFPDWTREDINDLLDLVEISENKKAKLELLHLLYQYIDFMEQTKDSYYPYEISLLKQYYMKGQKNIVYDTSVRYPSSENPSVMRYIQDSFNDFQFNTPFNYIFMGVFILMCLFFRTLLYSSFLNGTGASRSYDYYRAEDRDAFETPPQPQPEKKKGLEIRIPFPHFLLNNSLFQKIMEYVNYT